jgi:predicted ATP-grasp superfamily ATP-dependent carboligase
MADPGLKKSVLVVGDDMRIFISVVRSLGRAGIEVHAFPFSAESPALSSRFIHHVHRTPDFESDHQGWVTAFLNLLSEKTFDLVIPCADAAIMVLHDNRYLFPSQKLAIPAANAIEPLFDKAETHRLCDELNIPSAPWQRLHDADTAKGLIAKFGLPLVVKPRRSHWAGSGRPRERVHVIENGRELQECLESIPDRSRFLVEGFFEGSGTGLSVLCSRGEILQAFQHRRLREGRGGCSSYRISEPVNVELRAAVERICLKLAHNGVCMFEFRVNPRSGKWILLEVNARFWGSMTLPLWLGLDYPRLLFDLVVEGKQATPKTYATGVRSRNILLDANNLMKLLPRQRRGGLLEWCGEVGDFALQPFRWLAGRETADSFSATDMLPALLELHLAVRMLMGVTWRRIRTFLPVEPEKLVAKKAIGNAAERS